MTTPPAPPPQPPAGKSSGQATASLVLGVAGFVLPVLASIPAIILGHLALVRIRKAGGALGGKGLAIAGLVLGYGTLAIGGITVLAAMGFAGAQTAINRAKQIKARKICFTLDQGVNAFYDEYGFLPTSPGTDIEILTDSPEGAGLLTVLLGYGSGGDGENAKNIRFFEAPEAKGQKDGIKYAGSGNSVTGLYDPWGEPYHVILDGDRDEQLDNPFGGPALRGRRVATYSFGKNGRNDGGVGDDVKSW